MSDEKLDEVRKRHADAIKRFGSYYFANAPFGKPQLRIGVQSFSFDYAPGDEDPRHDSAHREWFGIMIAVALKNLVDGETAELQSQLAEAKVALGWALKQLDDLEDFHDSDTKPCCEYGAECPISMGEWFDDDDRGKLKKAHATLAKLEKYK